MTSIVTSIKRWWRNHRWVDVRDNYIIPHKLKTFWLNADEQKKAETFKKKHESNFYQYCFTPGPIGVCTHIKCKGENGELYDEDITDYGSW